MPRYRYETTITATGEIEAGSPDDLRAIERAENDAIGKVLDCHYTVAYSTTLTELSEGDNGTT